MHFVPESIFDIMFKAAKRAGLIGMLITALNEFRICLERGP
jgi:hypothetical protein